MPGLCLCRSIASRIAIDRLLLSRGTAAAGALHHCFVLRAGHARYIGLDSISSGVQITPGCPSFVLPLALVSYVCRFNRHPLIDRVDYRRVKSAVVSDAKGVTHCVD